MEFVRISFVPNISFDGEYFRMAIQLQSTGAGLFGNHFPTLQPIYEGGINNRLPFAFLTLRWTYIITDQNDNPVLTYIAESRYRINPRDYNLQDVREAVAHSFDEMTQNFLDTDVEGMFLDEPPQPEQSEFESLCENTLQFLNGRTQ